MLIVQTSNHPDRRDLVAWQARERVEYVADIQAAFARARAVGARMVVLDYDAWLPGTAAELESAVLAGSLTVPLLVRASVTTPFVADLARLARLPITLDVLVRREGDGLLSTLERGLQSGAETATIPALRALDGKVPRAVATVLAALLVFCDRPTRTRGLCAALGMGERKFFDVRRASGFPSLPDVRGTLFAMHVEHWTRVLGWDAKAIALLAQFSDRKALNEYLARHVQVTCTEIAKRGTNGALLAAVRGWFGT